jgi:hypothetical protein
MFFGLTSETNQEKQIQREHFTNNSLMERWSNFQKSAIVPAFRELRACNIFATVQKLACCQTCANGDLSEQHTSYIFFHIQDKDGCIETPTSQPLKLYLGYAFESVDVQAVALAILKKHCLVDWNGDYSKRICVSPKVPPSVQ